MSEHEKFILCFFIVFSLIPAIIHDSISYIDTNTLSSSKLLNKVAVSSSSGISSRMGISNSFSAGSSSERSCYP